jgi:hypothetical protein
MNDVQVPVSDLLQTQGHAGHRAHEGGVHHRAILEVDDEFTVAAVHHFLGEFLQVSAVQEVAFALDLDPDGLTVDPNLNR